MPKDVIQKARSLWPAILLLGWMGATQNADGPRPSSGPASRQAGDSSGPSAVLSLTPEAQQLVGLVVAPVRATELRPESQAFGKLEVGPGGSWQVRSPVAGYLHSPRASWPAPGAIVADEARIGALQPRFAPLEELDVASQVVEARASIKEIEAELAAARASYESKRALNASGKLVSDRELESARSTVQSDEARLAAAQHKLELAQAERDRSSRGQEPLPLTLGQGGLVVDAPVSPGEYVAAGQVLLRVADVSRLVARVQLSLGESWQTENGPPRIRLAGGTDPVLPAEPIGQAGTAGAQTGGQTWLLAVANPRGAWQAGMPVVAYLPQSGAPQSGVIVPFSALVRYGGLAWVYVQSDEQSFERRALQGARPTPDGWFVPAGLSAGENVVVTGAQELLSEQLKEQIEAEEEASE